MSQFTQHGVDTAIVQGTTFPTIFVQVLGTPECLMCWLILFGRFKGTSKYLFVNENTQFLDYILFRKFKVQHYKRAMAYAKKQVFTHSYLRKVKLQH